MNYIKEAENILWYYNDLYRSVENLNREIAKIVGRQGPSALTAIQLDQSGIRGSGDADDNTYNLLFRLKTLSENREKTLAELEKVNGLLDEISRESGCELYGQVLKEWYIHKTPKDEIAKRVGYSQKKSIYQIRSQAIRKFAVRHFGLEAIKVI
jgi:hypothetical protein